MWNKGVIAPSRKRHGTSLQSTSSRHRDGLRRSICLFSPALFDSSYPAGFLVTPHERNETKRNDRTEMKILLTNSSSSVSVFIIILCTRNARAECVTILIQPLIFRHTYVNCIYVPITRL